ncbi:MAG TPA: dihydroorotase [Candidatus Hydrogenedentes bacterium]|nr:dihydroorotase [Candidatus Hydrogenedentota bacterium]
MSLAIVNGHVIEPTLGLSEPMDLLIDHGVLVKMGKNLRGDETIDAAGCVVCPGLVDIHVHFREPGYESKETIASGSRAAAKGGVTTVVTMANTNPVIDNAGMVEFIVRRARETACIKIRPAACATKGMKGEEITEMAELKEVGAVAVSDDGRDVTSSAVMRRVLQYADMAGLVCMSHNEDETLAEGGSMNEGFNSTILGIPGIPKAAEEIRIDRNIRLAELTGARLHIQHVTSAEGVQLVRRAKAKGLCVTCETAPHYWMLTDDAVKTFNSNAKMNPPLREPEDVKAIIEGIKDGTIDCIATDHAPHTPTEKAVEFALAPFGIIGLETSLALVITGLVEKGHLSLERAIALMTTAPSQICDLNAGILVEGGPADVAVFDPNAEWVVKAEEFASRSKNSPFLGMTLRGKVKCTICDGNVVYFAS